MSKKLKDLGVGEEVVGMESVGEATVVEETIVEAEPVVEAPVASTLFVDEAGNEWVLTPSGEKIRL